MARRKVVLEHREGGLLELGDLDHRIGRSTGTNESSHP
jgi:hypothetical protein